MKKEKRHTTSDTPDTQRGIVLLVTLVILVVLAMLGYTISVRIATQRHRNQYIIDYQAARYGCDSAVKYALASLQDIQPQIISRPNEPDFSDLFILSKEQYLQLLAQIAPEPAPEKIDVNVSFPDSNDINDVNDVNDVNGVNDINEIKDANYIHYVSEPNSLSSATIRGPYGPAWPLITEPVEFEVGSATVRIEIEDENAKFPLGWAVLEDKQFQQEADAALETLCEWVGFDYMQEYPGQKKSLIAQLEDIGQIKQFKLDFQPITKLSSTPVASARASSVAEEAARRRRARVVRSRPIRRTVPVSEQIAEQTSDFAKLFHSSLINAEVLAKPYIEAREESLLKYLGVWGSTTVNINTAPRHVLEAAFAFGGPSQAPQIANEIIKIRRIKPFNDLKELKQSLFSYSDSISKCEKYITTTSNFFTIKVTAVSGVAKTSSIIAVTKTGNVIKPVALSSI